MRIRAAAPDHPRAWEVVAPPGTTVAALAAAAGLPRASHYALGGRAVAATVSLEQAGVAEGALLAPLGAPPAPAAVALVVVDGPRAGQVWSLAAGRHHVGRHPSMDVLLDDPDVAACHAELCIGTDGSCSVRDRGSATGTWIDGRRIEHAVVLDHGTALRIGGTTFRVHDATRAALAAPRDGTPRHRPPRRLPSPAPAPPEPVPPFAPPPAAATPRGLLSMLVPSLAGVAVAGAVHPSLLPLAAVAPIGAAATWSVLRGLDVRARRTARAAHAELVHAHDGAAARHEARLVRRLVERHPDLGEIACRVRRGDERLWERRAPHDDFLRLAVGTLGGAPVEFDLRAPVGIVGPRAAAVGVARALVVQLAAHHGPADCAITGCTGGALEWRWLDWLPHPTDAATPARVLVVDLAATGPLDRAAWRAHLAAGGTALVVAPRRVDLPEECATVVEVTGRAARVTRTTTSDPEDVEHLWTISVAVADDLAAALAPLRDADATTAATDLPGEVRLLDHRPATEIAERWRTGRRGSGLALPLGIGPDGPLLLDLVADGPHGLIAGTTGAGKSELLRTVVASLAASYDTARVAFVLVDYKGGSAFDGLAALPHVVDVVTDLDIATARRAIAGLEAEVHRRERLLRVIGVRDIAELHARDRDPAGASDPAFPRLVIVVDEFATLAQDLPEFVDALVDVAQRGRSLGVHLLLATQRPSGAVKDAIRTNTNIRIALRVLDAADSRDVLGTDDAAAIPRERVGRALLRRGPGSIVAFQCAHVSGVAPEVQHAALTLVPVGVAPPVRTAPIGTRRDLDVLVDAITDAHRAGGFATPARPWSDPPPGDITLAALWAAADEADDAGAAGERVPGSWPFGLLDEPHAQRHTIAAWCPTAGHLLVAGMAGSGTSTALCTVAATALREHAGGPPDVYVLATSVAPYGALAEHDAVGGVLTVDDDERVRRLLRVLGERVDAHRRGHGAPVPALVLVDGIGALRAAHDSVAGLEVLDALERVAADGAGCGVHLAFACEHPAALGHRLDRTIAHRVLLRLPDRHDYASTGVRDLDPRTLAPGAGIDAASGLRVQVAHARPADLVPRPLAPGATRRRHAPQVRVLPDRVTAHDLPAATIVAGVLHLPLAIGDTDLVAVGPALRDHEHVLVTGPARSGRTTVLDVAAHVARAGGLAVVRVASPRSGGGRGLTARGEIVDALEEARAAEHRTLVLVDDADQVDDGGALERVVTAADHRIAIVATVRNDRLRSAYRHWTTELRRGGHGVLLRVDDADGDLLGVRLPRGGASRVAGRGWLVRDGDVERAQFACVEGTTQVAP